MSDKLETCKNCRWWWPNKMIKTASVLDEMDLSGGYACTSKMMSMCRDSDGIYTASAMVTGPDFGCIHWEAKLPL